MGVRGFTPFLQKTCPDVFKVLPNRLKSLRGKRLAIDGTLLTQRLHFAPMTHPYRHVLGWYRIIKELQEENISAICVFDGPHRSVAKKSELERRRQVRKTLGFRGTLESNRLRRLMKMKTIITSLHQDPSSIDDTTEMLRMLDTLADRPDSCFQDENISDMLRVESDNLGEFDEDDINEALFIQSHTTVEPLHRSTFTELRSNDQPPNAAVVAEEKESQSTLIPSLEILHREYQETAPQVTALDSPDATLKDGGGDESLMSKTQQQLTQEEGELWSQISQSPTAQGVIAAIAALADKSLIMCKSYDRRNNPPTNETYEECKAILRSMGVPCIVPSGAFEAEALASSLVVNDYADMVVSEDTDVIVYEAPMVRNLTRHDMPLVVVSGSDVRESLSLDRSRFVDLALLMGTDFSQRLKNVGPTRALNLIREHGSIENVLKSVKKKSHPESIEEFLEQVKQGREVFASLPAIPPAKQLKAKGASEATTLDILKRYGLSWVALESLAHEDALPGNYYDDNPSAG